MHKRILSVLYNGKMPLWVFWALLTAVYSAIFITIEFSGTPFSSFQGFLVIFSQWCVVSLAAGGVLGLITFNRIIFAVLFPLLVLLSVEWMAYAALTICPAIDQNTRPKILNIKEEKRYEL